MSSQEKPLVSFLVIAYNQERFIREAVMGAFWQTYSPLEIILSDDCSSDRTFEIMQEMAESYVGPHTVTTTRNSQNLGIGRHYSRVMELATGEIIELAAGDDISLPWRTVDSVTLLDAHPDLSCVSLGIQRFVDVPSVPPVADGKLTLSARWSLDDFVLSSGYLVNAPGRAFRKFTHDVYGPLLDECPVEDGSSLLRCLLHGDIAACDKPGVLYRWNGRNVSSPENIARIRISSIYVDFLNTVRISYERGYIDSDTHHKLTHVFEAERDRFEVLEALRIGARRPRAIVGLFTSRYFSPTDKAKLAIKWAIGRV